MFCIWKLRGSFTSHKTAPRRWRDMIALITVLNVTLMKLWGSALGCHCPDGDGIWWKGSGGCTQSEQQPAKRSREYRVLLRSVPLMLLILELDHDLIKSTPTEDSGAQILCLLEIGCTAGAQGLWGWETPSPQPAKEIVLSWERRKYSQE